MIRLLHIPEQHCVLLVPVPNNHPKDGFQLFKDGERAEENARMLLNYQEEREKWLYSMGLPCPDPHLKKAENWKPHSDAAVGRRILKKK